MRSNSVARTDCGEREVRPTTRRGGWVAWGRPLAAVSALAIAAPAASGALRYATPTDSASKSCTAAAPCTLTVAVNNGVAGDEVILLPGTYRQATPLSVRDRMTVRGEIGTRPTIEWVGNTGVSALAVSGSSTTVRDVRITGRTGAPAGRYSLLRLGGPGTVGVVADRVIVEQLGDGPAVEGRVGVTVQNSVIRAVGATAAILGGRLVGSTVVATAPDGVAVLVPSCYGDFVLRLNVRNSIVRGGTGAGGRDLLAWQCGSPGDSAQADIDYSSFTEGRLEARGDALAIITRGANNVTEPPRLVDLLGGTDVHQLAGSPTIDRGDPAAVVGDADIDGNSRVINRPDIGADEFVPPTAIPIPAGLIGRLLPPSPLVRSGRSVPLIFSTTLPMRVTLAVERVRVGRTRSGRCVVGATTGRRCTARALRARVRVNVAAGPRARIVIPAKPGGRVLAPGTYLVTATAVDANGQRTNTRRIFLTVRRAPTS